MKTIVPFIILSILLLSGTGTPALNTNERNTPIPTIQTEGTSLVIDVQPTITENDGYLTLQLTGVTTQFIEPDKPVVPICIKTFEIPFKSTNIHLICTPHNIGIMTLAKQIAPARVAPISKLSNKTPYVKNETIYNSTTLYPDRWYTTELSTGRNDRNQEVTTVKVICYPIRYSPVNNEVTYAGSFNISLNYTPPPSPLNTQDAYEMVIIAPESFHAKLQPLIDEKNTKGIATTFKSIEDILARYNGTDPPEQVKYFIKDAYDTWNITYVLLVGGLKSHLNAHDKDTRSAGYTDWWVPVRYVNIPQDEDEGCLSDLYYGCLYNATGAFDSWDSNHDGIYAAWDAPGVPDDTFDMNPEVYVSRLPVANAFEAGLMTRKIIRYENTGPDAKPWYKNFIGIGGKTFDYYMGKPDGEYLCDLAYNYTKNAFPDLTLTPVYSSNRDTGGFVPITKDITKAISQGAGFVDFEGHGNPIVWDTIWFDGTYPNDWCGGINILDFFKIYNGNKLPVVIVGGCHNGLYNISLVQAMRDKNGSQYFCYGYPAPYCFSWGLVLKYPGGAIGATGDTGFGMGYEGNPVTLSAELESNFFYEIGNGAITLGQAHGRAIQKFIAEEAINQVEAFCITNWALFGDPSLRLGGYPS
jgi:hypothetical protein